MQLVRVCSTFLVKMLFITSINNHNRKFINRSNSEFLIDHTRELSSNINITTHNNSYPKLNNIAYRGDFYQRSSKHHPDDPPDAQGYKRDEGNYPSRGSFALGLHNYPGFTSDRSRFNSIPPAPLDVRDKYYRPELGDDITRSSTDYNSRFRSNNWESSGSQATTEYAIGSHPPLPTGGSNPPDIGNQGRFGTHVESTFRDIHRAKLRKGSIIPEKSPPRFYRGLIFKSFGRTKRARMELGKPTQTKVNISGQHQIIHLSINIAEFDIRTKARLIRKYLDRGNPVMLRININHGGSKEFIDKARKIFNIALDSLSDVAKFGGTVQIHPQFLSQVINPIKRAADEDIAGADRWKVLNKEDPNTLPPIIPPEPLSRTMPPPLPIIGSASRPPMVPPLDGKWKVLNKGGKKREVPEDRSSEVDIKYNPVIDDGRWKVLNKLKAEPISKWKVIHKKQSDIYQSGGEVH